MLFRLRKKICRLEQFQFGGSPLNGGLRNAIPVEKSPLNSPRQNLFLFVVPKIEHYGCMVDMLSRAGHVGRIRHEIVALGVSGTLVGKEEGTSTPKKGEGKE